MALPRGHHQPLAGLVAARHPHPAGPEQPVARRRRPPPPGPAVPRASTRSARCSTSPSRGDDHSWFVLDKTILGSEFALSGSEQNPDLTGKDMKLLLRAGQAGRGRAGRGVRGEVRRVPLGRHPRRAGREDERAVRHGPHRRRRARAHDRRARPAGRDRPRQGPAGVATAMARRYVVDKLIRVAKPHRLLDPAHGPLLAVRLSVLTRKTLGGLHTDLEGRVLRPDGEVLPGPVGGRRGVRVRRRRGARAPRARGHVPGRLPVHGSDGRARTGHA